jgi:hypothetical protein
VAKKKPGEVALAVDIPEPLRRLLRTTVLELQLAGDDVSLKHVVAETLADGIARTKARRLKALRAKGKKP